MRAPPLALALVALALTGCATTAEKSHELERRAHVVTAGQKGLSISRPSKLVVVVSTAIVTSPEGVAAVVELRNRSSRALRDVPIALDVEDQHGRTLYRNDTPGLAPTLTSAPLLPAHADATWIDDQVTPGAARRALVDVGEAASVSGALPSLAITAPRIATDQAGGPSVEGSVVNHSDIEQENLVIYAVARRGRRIVAAGRAVAPVVTPGGSARFQLFFIGDPHGASLSFSAPPTEVH